MNDSCSVQEMEKEMIERGSIVAVFFALTFATSSACGWEWHYHALPARLEDGSSAYDAQVHSDHMIENQTII